MLSATITSEAICVGVIGAPFGYEKGPHPVKGEGRSKWGLGDYFQARGGGRAFGVDPSDVEVTVDVAGVESAFTERDDGPSADGGDGLLVAVAGEVWDADA